MKKVLISLTLGIALLGPGQMARCDESRPTDDRPRIRRSRVERPSPIEPGRVYRYTIDCWNTAQVFRKGHRICLQLASSAFPKYDRNLNTGESLATGTRMVVAEQQIHHDAMHPSCVILPIVPRG